MSLEKWLGTIALPMDASCTVVLPMARMHGVQQHDLGSRTDFCQWRVVKSCDSLSIPSSSLLLHGSVEQ